MASFLSIGLSLTYIKPQLNFCQSLHQIVVYLLIPTSNHNLINIVEIWSTLYIFWFLHQTTTWSLVKRRCKRCISFDSYIKPQPDLGVADLAIVVYLLIPTSNHNPPTAITEEVEVVYLLIPTSNHNYYRIDTPRDTLYIFWFLHQTTTIIFSKISFVMLYIFWFLHQTTTMWWKRRVAI